MYMNSLSWSDTAVMPELVWYGFLSFVRQEVQFIKCNERDFIFDDSSSKKKSRWNASDE